MYGELGVKYGDRAPRDGESTEGRVYTEGVSLTRN